MDKWEILGIEKVLDNNWITVEKHKCKVSENLIIDDYFLVRKKDFVVLVIEDGDEIFFIKQYRHGVGDHVVNLPMGLIDDNENPEDTARREFLEETGYKVDHLEHLGEFYQSPSYISTKVHVLYAKNPIKDENSLIDNLEGELILMKISKDELRKKIKNNEIKDVSTLMALYVAQKRLELF